MGLCPYIWLKRRQFYRYVYLPFLKKGIILQIYRNQSFIDIVPKDSSKSDGISKALSSYDVKEDNVFVIGDSWNDLSMFEKYKNSYTFSYAEEELKPHATNVVDAFYDCLENILD